MVRVKELAIELLNASTEGNVLKCMEISEKIKKIMDTYKESC